MPRSLTVGIALLTHATLAQAQGTHPAQPPTTDSAATAVLAGNVMFRPTRGDHQGMRIHLVPDSAARTWGPDCEARDSSNAQYVRLRRPARLAYEAAQTSNERSRAQHLARAESARAAAFAAREPAARVEAAIIAWLDTQPATRTGEAGDYVFDGIAPGRYALYANAAPTHFWLVPVTVVPGHQRGELAGANVTLVQYVRVSNAAARLCGYVEMPVHPDSGLIAVEQLPSVRNRADVGRALLRRYPRVLRQAGVPAQVTVRFRVFADGTVDPETVEAVGTTMDGSPFQGEIEAAAELVAESMRFAPAQVDGRPVAVWVVQPFSFTTPD